MSLISFRTLLLSGLAGFAVSFAFPPLEAWPFAWLAYILFSYLIVSPKLSILETVLSALFFNIGMNFGVIRGIPAASIEAFGQSLELHISSNILFYFLYAFPFVTLISIWKTLSLRIVAKTSLGLMTKKLLLLFVGFVLLDWLQLQPFPWSPYQAIGVDSTLISSVGVIGTAGWRTIFFAQVTLTVLALKSQIGAATRLLILSTILITPIAIADKLGRSHRENLKNIYSAKQPVLLVQDNAASPLDQKESAGFKPSGYEDKLRKELFQEVKSQAHKFAAKLGNKPPELWIFWSEGIFSNITIEQGTLPSIILNPFQEMPDSLQVMGVLEVKAAPKPENFQTYNNFNSVIFFDNDKGYLDHYRKSILFPFGEYVPKIFQSTILHSVFVQNRQYFTHGDGPHALVHPDENGPIFISLICLEAIIPSYVDAFLSSVKHLPKSRNRVLVIPSSDRSFTGSAIPLIHALLVRWQSARHSLSTIRTTTNGLTQIIAPWGDVIAEAPTQTRFFLKGFLPVSNQITRNK